MKNKFYLFEGIDASGKSSMAKALAEKIDGVYYYSPPKIMRPLRELADKSHPRIRFVYYLLGNIIGSKEIKKLLKKKNVVADWYIFSTIAYHSVLLNKRFKIPKILMPDKIFYVYASIPEIEKRLSSRPIRSKYEEINFLQKVKSKYEELLTTYSNVQMIDTTGNVIEESLKKIEL